MFLCLLGMYLEWNSLVIVVVQLSRSVQLSGTQWTAACQASLSFTSTLSLLKFMPLESVMPSDHLILCCPLLLLFSVFPGIRVFSSESALCIRWPKDWSFSISPSNEYSGLISLRVFSSTTVQNHQFLGAQLFLWSKSLIHTWLLEKS